MCVCVLHKYVLYIDRKPLGRGIAYHSYDCIEASRSSRSHGYSLRFWRPWMLEAEAPAWIRNCLAARGFKPEICKAP